MLRLQVPGSKSITNRALIVAALAHGKSVLKNALASDDTIHLLKALRALGVEVKKKDDDFVVMGGTVHAARGKIFCGNAGTTMRFLSAVCALFPFETVLDGDTRMRERPLQDLIDALRQLGVDAVSLKKDGYPPVKITGPATKNSCTVKGTVSSQFLSGLLLAAPLSPHGLTISIQGDLVSKPYVDMTIEVMRAFGVHVQRNGYKKFFVRGGQNYRARVFSIEGDASSASYFYGIGHLAKTPVEILNIPPKSIQGDVEFIRALKKIPGKINGEHFPDAAMTLAMICACTKGTSRLTGLTNLRVKESDRLHAITVELKKIGANVQELNDGWLIKGNPDLLHGARIKTYNDHRMAMCFGMLGVVIPGIVVENPACVTKTYPHFWKDLMKVKKQLAAKNIILTGMRGTGKSELGKIVARILKRPFIDIDAKVEQRAKKPISEIVRQSGWQKFRSLETQQVRALKNIHQAVIATGGGTLMKKKNAQMLKKNGMVVYLLCDIQKLKKRIRESTNRPSLTHGKNFIDELGAIFKKRKRIYESVADITIDVSRHTDKRSADLEYKANSIITALQWHGIR